MYLHMYVYESLMLYYLSYRFTSMLDSLISFIKETVSALAYILMVPNYWELRYILPSVPNCELPRKLCMAISFVQQKEFCCQ